MVFYLVCLAISVLILCLDVICNAKETNTELKRHFVNNIPSCLPCWGKLSCFTPCLHQKSTARQVSSKANIPIIISDTILVTNNKWMFGSISDVSVRSCYFRQQLWKVRFEVSSVDSWCYNVADRSLLRVLTTFSSSRRESSA